MLPWPEMMRAALSAGVPVTVFWRLSVREWRWLSEGGGAQNMNLGGLAELMQNFPDKETDNGRI